MKVAAAQIIVESDVAKNLEKILEYIKKARRADVVCFPEVCLQCEKETIKSLGREIKKICDAAKENNINVIFGAYVKEEEKIRNKIFVVNKSGEIIYKYNKRNPYKTEQEYVASGKINKPFMLDGIPCAVINCWDYAYPEYLRMLAKKGAIVIFCPAYLLSHPLTHNVLRKIPQVRAFDTMSYFVMVDAIGEETYMRSRICHPLHQIDFIKDKEGIIYAEIDEQEILELRKKLSNF